MSRRGRINSVSGVLTLVVLAAPLLAGIGGCGKKQAPPIQSDQEVRRASDAGMQRMLREQGRAPR